MKYVAKCNVSVYLPADVAERLEEYCYQNRMNRSEAVRQFIEKGLSNAERVKK